MARRSREHPTHVYAESVRAGGVAAGELVRLACERHLTDLAAGARRRLFFDEAAALHAIAFFRFLRHSKGQWAGVRFDLEPWQQFIIGCLFGWMREDDEDGVVRRFNTAYVEVPRKNGKTTMSAGVGLYLFSADGEPGAEVYTAATKRDQARLAHGEATRMVKSSALLRKAIRIQKDNLSIEQLHRTPPVWAKYEPLGADADTMDGLNPHGAIIDEVHAHPNRAVVDVLQTAVGARRNALLFEITTAGYDRQSVCFEEHERSSQVVRGVLTVDDLFGFIATIDEGDEWQDEAVWAKANPNYGVTVKKRYLRDAAQKALQVPAYQNTFRRLHLNEWTKQEERWLALDAWDASSGIVDPAALRGRKCYGGLDLASTIDIAAFVLVFPPAEDDAAGVPYHVLPHFWVPEENMRERAARDRVPYDAWARDRFLTATPGNVIDYGAIVQRIVELGREYNIAEIAFDRWGAIQMSQQLADAGFTVVPFGQGFVSMSSPTKELLRLVLEKRLRHGGHPVLRWMCDNMVVRQDPAGNLKPDREKSREKIDGIVATIMALDRSLRHEKAVTWRSA